MPSGSLLLLHRITHTQSQGVLYSCSSSCRTSPTVHVEPSPYTDIHTHTHTHRVVLTEVRARTHTHTQVINQTVISTNSPLVPRPSPSHTCRHTPVEEAAVGGEWWALRATGQGPHEKPLCLGGTEQRGHQVHRPNEGWFGHQHTHAHTHTHRRGREGVYRLNQPYISRC